MAAASSTGVSGALLALLIFGVILNFVDSGPLLNRKLLSHEVHHETAVVKPFGYGDHILLQALVNTATVRDQHKQSYAVRGKCQSDSLIIITLYLLLSGDVHPCPGPTSQGASTEDMKKKHQKMNFFKTVTHSRMIWDSQHKPSSIF